jgi:diguanylate cyclase (GGDEF)-like protein
MILPNTSSAGAVELAARISKTIHAHKIEGMNSQKISTSMGCATFVDNNVTSADALVKLADDAMYRSKAQGKGRVIQA